MVMIWRSALSFWRYWWYVDVDDDNEVDCYQNGGDGIVRWRKVIKDDDEFITIFKKDIYNILGLDYQIGISLYQQQTLQK